MHIVNGFEKCVLSVKTLEYTHLPHDKLSAETVEGFISFIN